MSASDTAGFGKFVPGFDFLQNLAKGASGISHMPNLANWVAPTLNVEELDKRIEELKNVHFWLEQNSRALAATIQALEVQKMTLATLKGMNFNLADVANALKPRMPEATAGSRAQAAPEPAAAPAHEAPAAPAASAEAPKAAKSAMVDPLQLWGSLTQQFQQIAATAVREAASQAAEMEKVRSAAVKTAAAASVAKPATPKASAPAGKKATAKRAPASKAAARKTAGQ
jgi:pterin-4a-carbinolamine dehydratase